GAERPWSHARVRNFEGRRELTTGKPNSANGLSEPRLAQRPTSASGSDLRPCTRPRIYVPTPPGTLRRSCSAVRSVFIAKAHDRGRQTDRPTFSTKDSECVCNRLRSVAFAR